MGTCSACGNSVDKTQPDPSTPTPPPPEDIFDAESLEFNCNQHINRCLSAQRIHSILIDFDKFRNEAHSCNINSMYQHIDELGSAYNNTRLINDYIHLVTVHQSNQDFEAIHNYFMSEMTESCDVIHCNYMKRNQRDRSNDYDNNTRQKLYNTTDTKEVNIHQIMDKMHCYWLHSFDLGYRLTMDERSTVEMDDIKDKEHIIYKEPIKPRIKPIMSDAVPVASCSNSLIEYQDIDIDDVLLYNCVDNELMRRRKIIISKRERLMNESNDVILNRNRSVFNVLNDRNGKFMLNTVGTKHKNEKDQIMYSFGFPYRYGRFHRKSEWYIAEKYDSLKEELTQNNIERITAECFDDWHQKALDHLVSDHCKQMKPYLSNAINVQHLMVIMIYCGTNSLQRSLTETYRKLGNETDDSLRKRHSEYAHWGHILKVATNNFGIKVENGSYKKFYHGIDEEMTFESTIAYFHGPLSTSSEYEAALLFAMAQDGGLIIELHNLDSGHASYFDCAWLSDYAYESEKFFIGGDDGLIIKNITAPQQSQNYEIYIEGLNIIQQMMRGLMYKNTNTKPIPKHIKRCVRRLLYHELHRYFANKYKEFDCLPQYIADSLHIYCLSVKEISIDWRLLHQENETRIDKGYKFTKKIFIDDEFNGSWLDLDVLCILFPNLLKLTVTDIALARDTLESIRCFCQKRKSDHHLKHIIIYRPTKDATFESNIDLNNGDDKSINKRSCVDKAIQDYAEDFIKYGWKMEKRARFELLINKI